ncbi:MAG: tRNA preQ1(34) S-adenosylmethionine ribosyltransferase-isomerase QueA [Parabacteroides sp.]|jgi:S-adenosylmethionine:tRNA ribosyltransferase-isomerase|uniref:S-adenosylmethionine:tRNA ribosyltransferase-isomerase n=1 Tax=Parabacteroides faecalis TaxID=2924040 RepID=A0ABT0C282_9BACT|nr:tRNA preQ1(34) S-adenosylmethionine ribosyltransferase-isomerase QueA [Parabacteroides faecalis]MBS7342314.1 tRNA preQ1(34) S-adenosylmethionine ribosyltransferase-isomerase QueA [Parabacteroides sp.]MDY5621600.1 tRNA preQ1(34) S-adenosylmethionine ribosyltransferase-isomerase QueA [Bacteroidales bacterium]HIX21755.1 tRNA preQ1(34) S-adenosylmethionine ribosyltransferase-isomerase QueA [Candidatus Parabacteroides faecavium]MCI7285835.1 tRNA preQ1(34) S-adenosylmethionine ribosyltransferase-i
MKLSKFKFNLPTEQIALYPSKNRDESRLMVVNRKTGKIEHRIFKEILDYFGPKDVFIFNNTRVFPARLYGNKEKTGARIEVFLLRELNEELRLWDVLVDPARKIRIGNKLYFGEDDSMVAEVIDNTTSRGRTLRFLYDGNHDDFKKVLYSLGETPLPKYIDRPVEPDDEERYQNIFATEEGAVVAPAAGMHFSRELMKRLEIKDCRFAFLTLHSGLGNFREIDVEDLTKHKMDSEQMFVNADVVSTVNAAKDSNNQICAVGTSVMRAIETAVSTDGHLKEFEGWTNKFIFPPYDFSVATSMVTNFHMPLSTLLMMTASFGGYELIMDAYDVALKEGYKFGAYGDAMLIL